MESKAGVTNNYNLHFNPKAYLERYYSSVEGYVEEEEGVLPWTLEILHSIFSHEGVSGDRLIDIGTGPCIYSFVSSCTKFKEIVVGEYSEQNRNALKRWVDNEPGSFDWSSIIEHVCQLEGHSEFKERESLLRKTIKDIIPCDVRLANPLIGHASPPKFDCMSSAYCLEVACRSKPEYVKCLKNMAGLLKTGELVSVPTTVAGTRWQ
ncbi:nicotinamide N-methyltransferase-like [Ptychodera flava]|uniref:nicotinamide N-methyltransferase-like n=1 Tax=Ptychodera flava TaxID=63121 RepID=UPI003969EB88